MINIVKAIIIASVFFFVTASAEEKKEITIEQIQKSVELHSIKGEAPPKYIQEKIIDAFNTGDESTINAIEKSSNPYVCCAYDCGYNGCKHKKVRQKACSTVGGSSVSMSNC